jgi:hypothetical protein
MSCNNRYICLFGLGETLSLSAAGRRPSLQPRPLFAPSQRPSSHETMLGRSKSLRKPTKSIQPTEIEDKETAGGRLPQHIPTGLVNDGPSSSGLPLLYRRNRALILQSYPP